MATKIQHKEGFKPGYTEITNMKDNHPEYLMDFGMLRMNKGMEFEDALPYERIFVLIYGEIEVEFAGKKVVGKRESYTNETIWCVNLPKDVPCKITGIAEDTQIAVIRTENDKVFEPVVRCGDAVREEVRGKGCMNEAGTRIVRTANDYSMTPESNIMFGEDMHYPGKWSGFPSHSHNQPEIYYYKFEPQDGFGLLRLGDEGVLLEHDDTVLIEMDKVHPQVTAPGYAMYYLWVIRHLDGNPYIKPNFDPKYLWVEEPGAKYWPDI